MPDPAKLKEYDLVVPGLADQLAREFLANERAHRVDSRIASMTAFGTVYGALAVACLALYFGAWLPAAVIGGGAVAASPSLRAAIAKILAGQH